MKYAVLKTGGKQYKVSEGQILEIERIDKKPKEKIEFSELLLMVDNGEIKLGQPLVSGARVEAEVLDQIKGPKIRVAKFKAKVRYRRVRGHRQHLTRVKIEKILPDGEKKKTPRKNPPKNSPKTVKTD